MVIEPVDGASIINVVSLNKVNSHLVDLLAFRLTASFERNLHFFVDGFSRLEFGTKFVGGLVVSGIKLMDGLPLVRGVGEGVDEIASSGLLNLRLGMRELTGDSGEGLPDILVVNVGVLVGSSAGNESLSGLNPRGGVVVAVQERSTFPLPDLQDWFHDGSGKIIDVVIQNLD